MCQPIYTTQCCPVREVFPPWVQAHQDTPKVERIILQQTPYIPLLHLPHLSLEHLDLPPTVQRLTILRSQTRDHLPTSLLYIVRNILQHLPLPQSFLQFLDLALDLLTRGVLLRFVFGRFAAKQVFGRDGEGGDLEEAWGAGFGFGFVFVRFRI